MTEEEVRELIRKKQRDGRIACETALSIAEETGVSPRRVGELLNEMKIKIRSCRLGCFK